MERSTRHRLAPFTLSLVLLLTLLLPAAAADASLILAAPDETSGTGLGAVNTVLTVQGAGSETDESGCVAWNGTMDVVGPAACPAGVPGGDEQAQTQTRTLADVGLSSAFNLRVVFNYNESQADTTTDDIDLEELVLTIYGADGSVCFSSGAFAPIAFENPFSGTGTSGFVFRLDAQQAAQAQPCFGDPANRIGLAAELGRAGAGLETFYVADAAAIAPAAADLELTKSDSPDPVPVGGTLTYTLEATNAGPNRATGVTITDTVPASLSGVTATSPDATCTVSGRLVTCVVGDLASGETATVTIAGTTTVDGRITNTAAVVGDQPDPEIDDNTAVEETTVGAGGGGNADLSLLKADAPDPVAVGQTLTYTLTVSNGGLATATGVTVTDNLPATVTLDAATVTTGSGTCTASGQTVVCELGDLANTETAVITIQVTPTTAGTISDTAVVSADQSDPNPGNNSDSEQTEVIPAPTPGVDLAIVKTDSVDPVTGGSNFAYTLEVTNEGSAAATGVTVRDFLPASVTFVSASPGCVEAGGIVTCDLGTVAAGATESVTLTVQSPNADVTLTNGATVAADQNDTDPSDNAAIEETVVDAGGTPADEVADLSIRKTDAPDPVAVGGQIVYSLRITNNGPNEANGFRVVDQLPPQVTFVTTSRNDICSESGGTVVCEFPSLFGGLTAFVDITVQAVAPGTALDVATVVPGVETDPNPANNQATEQTTIGGGQVPTADLDLTKTDAPDPVAVGGVLTYTLLIENDGPSVATGVELVDTLPAGVTFQSAVAAPGTCAESGGVVVCDIGTLAVGATATVEIEVIPEAPGTLLNTAVVSANEADPEVAENVGQAVTEVGGQPEVTEIPTLGEWGLMLLALLVGGAGLRALRQS